MNTTEPQVTAMSFAPIETAPELHNVLVCWNRNRLEPRMAFRDGDDWFCAVTGRTLKMKPSGWLDPNPS